MCHIFRSQLILTLTSPVLPCALVYCFTVCDIMSTTTTTTTTVTTITADGKVSTTTNTSSATSGKASTSDKPPLPVVDYDVVCVGAGMSGLYLIKLARDLGLSVRCFETAKGVGGTWWWNRYPGAKVDVESRQYSYTWAQDVEKKWQWKHRYGQQEEIRAYLDAVADTYDLKKDIQFETSVVSAVWNEETFLWNVTTSDGASCTARWYIMATGCLSKFNKPNIPGADTFKGTVLTTYDFPEGGFDFSGKRVAVVGTGSTAGNAVSVGIPVLSLGSCRGGRCGWIIYGQCVQTG